MDDTAQIIRFPGGDSARRRIVRLALADARWWIEQGLAGAQPLESAVAEAHLALLVAEREACQGALS
jgi:hypothetical protein